MNIQKPVSMIEPDILSNRMSSHRLSRRDLLKAGALGFAAMNLPTPSFAQEPQKASGEWLKKAQEVYAWLRTMRIEGTDLQVSYKVAEGVNQSEPSLYSGTAGVLLFLHALNEVSMTSETDSDRRGASNYIRYSMAKKGAEPDFGLYTGSSGFTRLLDNPRLSYPQSYGYMKAIGKSVLEHWKRRQAEPNVFASNDIISGLAGLSLMVQSKSESHAFDIDSDTPTGIGPLFEKGLCDELIARADKTGKGWRWGYVQGVTRNMPNFSHGTAGVAYALAVKFVGFQNEQYLEGALKGVEYLQSVADTSNGGYKVFYDNVIDPPLFYLGYCHGPIGTARLFIKLHQIQPEKGWLELAERCAKSVMDSECDKHETTGFWNNHGICCGNAGVAMFFMDMYRETKKQAYLDYAKAHIAVIDARATVDEKGRRWTWAENRKSPKDLSTQTGLMQGAAGVGLMYLNMHALVNGRDWTHRLPDDPWFKIA